MSRHTSFRIGGPARRMALPGAGGAAGAADELCPGVRGPRPLVMGNGTNLLVLGRGGWTGW